MADRPLSDVVVLDLTRALAGPVASRLLADLGADVIKIEPPEGDLTRSIVPRVDGMSVYFAHYNAGKRCVSLDLTRPEGREVFLAMVEKADVVFENYRPAVMAKLGLDYDVLAARNPKIILASVSGWGHGNSRSEQGAYASAIHAEAGVTAKIAARRGENPPRNDPISHADVYTGMNALAAVLAALYMRSRTGRGQAVEVSMAESMLLTNDLAAVELHGGEPATGFRAGQNWSPIFALGNGRHVSITMDITTNAGFELFSRRADRADLVADPRFAKIEDRVRNRAALEAELAPWVAQFEDPRELERAIGQSTILVAEVRTVPELAATEWAAERGAFAPVDVGNGTSVTVPQSAWRFSDADAGAGGFAGFRGQHNREVLSSLVGMADVEIDALVESGVLSDRLPDWFKR